MSAPGPYSIGSDFWNGLSKLIEETGEVQQVAGKIIGNSGRVIHFDGSNLRERLTEELGDLMAAIQFFVDRSGAVSQHDVYQRANRKLALFVKWDQENKS